MAKIQKFEIGETVQYFTRSYVRGTRRPGFNGRYTYRFASLGTLIARNDPRALAYDPATRNMTPEQYQQWSASHIGFQNATGATGEDGLSEGNNVVLLPNGEVVWVYREQIRKVK